MLEEDAGEWGVVLEVRGGAQGARGHGVHPSGLRSRSCLLTN